MMFIDCFILSFPVYAVQYIIVLVNWSTVFGWCD